jgi:hypothetical protein
MPTNSQGILLATDHHNQSRQHMPAIHGSTTYFFCEGHCLGLPFAFPLSFMVCLYFAVLVQGPFVVELAILPAASK